MCITEYDEEKTLAETMEDGIEIGIEIGLEKGMKQGMEQGMGEGWDFNIDRRSRKSWNECFGFRG